MSLVIKLGRSGGTHYGSPHNAGTVPEGPHELRTLSLIIILFFVTPRINLRRSLV